MDSLSAVIGALAVLSVPEVENLAQPASRWLRCDARGMAYDYEIMRYMLRALPLKRASLGFIDIIFLCPVRREIVTLVS